MVDFLCLLRHTFIYIKCTLIIITFAHKFDFKGIYIQYFAYQGVTWLQITFKFTIVQPHLCIPTIWLNYAVVVFKKCQLFSMCQFSINFGIIILGKENYQKENPSSWHFCKKHNGTLKCVQPQILSILATVNFRWPRNRHQRPRAEYSRRIIQVNSWYKRKIQAIREIWILSPIVHRENVVRNTTVPNKRNPIINPKRHGRALKWLKRSKLQFWTSSTLRFRVKGSHWLAAERHLEKRAFQETFTFQTLLLLKPKWHL